MQARFYRTPSTCRVVKSVPTVTIQSPASRNMSLFGHAHPLFRGGFVPSASSASSLYSNEIAPLFRLLDDYATSASRAFDSLAAGTSNGAGSRGLSQFQPRFDVREVDNVYELRGELPGVENKDVEIEFTDRQTLVVRGRTERESTTSNGAAPATAITNENLDSVTALDSENTNSAKVVQDDDAVSNHSDSSYHKATVEDAETGEVESSSYSGANTPKTVNDVTTPAQPETQTQTQTQTQSSSSAPSDAQGPASVETGKGQYWLSERSIGTFKRVFQFPALVNHDAVTASLKNGILSVSVPKLEQTVRRINIE